MLDDTVLILRFKLGSRNALRQIYEKYKDDLLKLAVTLTNDVNTAEDTVQDVFMRLAQSAGTIKTKGNLRSYLMTCVANRIRNARRDQKRHEAPAIGEPGCCIVATRLPEQWVILSEQLAILSNAMSQMPCEQREVVALYMQGNMTFRQISRVQKVSINTVQSRYRYALDKLRSALDHEIDQ
jgi:RNA polymerase sigma-70 factor (ECF subfamily)